MSNYIKTTNFTAKDNLPSGNAAKKIVGSEFDTEFNNISTAIATKADTTAVNAVTTTADAALPKAGGAMTGAITTNSTFDGRNVATDGTKLDAIEASADVTDVTNVTAAGALMDSEVTNLAQVKAFASADYATAAQGTLATNALPKAGGTLTGALNVTGISQFAANISVVDDILLVGTSPTFQCHNSNALPAASAVLGTVSFGTIGETLELPKTATIVGIATSQWSTGVAPTDIVLSTTAAASGSSLTERMRITADDGIKVTTPAAASATASTFKNGTLTAGKINTHFTNTDAYLSIGNKGAGLQFVDFQASRFIVPFNVDTNANSDNLIDLGNASARFDDIYATNATIQTSDRNEKQDIEELTDAETRVAVACKGLLRKFRWKSSVEEKGTAARTHFGIIAQDLQAAFEAEGLDAGEYAMFISTTWTNDDGEEQTRLGVRYSELLAFIIGGI